MAAGPTRNETVVTTMCVAVQAEVTEGGNADKSGLVSKVQLQLSNAAVRQLTDSLHSKGTNGSLMPRAFCAAKEPQNHPLCGSLGMAAVLEQRNDAQSAG